MPITLAELAQRAGVELQGEPDYQVSNVAPLETAGPGDISFLGNPRYRTLLDSTRAGAVILSAKDAGRFDGNCLVTGRPYVAYARIAEWLHPRPAVEPGVHATAVIGSGVRLAASCSIGPGVVIEDGVAVGERTVIGAGSFIGANTTIGDDSRLWARVCVYHDCVIGRRCVLHAGSVIGADGFGFANDDGRWLPIPQLGRVVVGDDVYVGANTTIDRGSLRDTTVGNGVKLDNLIQIAHNVEIGEHTAMAACVGVAGSTRIGARCTFGGRAGVLDNIDIADDVHVSATSLVTKSIREPGVYSSVVPLEDNDSWRKNAARIRHLDRLARRLREVEKELDKLRDRSER